MANFIKKDDNAKKIEKEDDQNLSNFLPDFLINKVNIVSPPSNSREENKNSQFFSKEPQEINDINSYLQNLYIEDKNQNQQRELRPPQNKFYSTSDVKDFKKKNHNRPPYKKQQSDIQKENVNNNYVNFPEQNYQFQTNQMSIFAFNTITHPYNSNNSNNSNSSISSNSNSNCGFNNIDYNKPRAFSISGLMKKPSSGRASLFRHDSEEKEEDEFETLQELMGSINMTLWEYAKKQKGSRNLQKLLDKIEPQELNTLLSELKNHFTELMIDTYGNYFCQKLIQSCSYEQRLMILSDIAQDFTFIACNPSGTHSIQTMIEIINMPSEEELLRKIIKNQILILSFNPNGTHVMQKILTTISEDQRPDINEVIMNSLPQLFNDSNGICVIKKFINGNKDLTMRNELLNYIQSNCLEIIQSPFGNYVIQHILDKWGCGIAKDIIETIIKNIVSLSMQKFSSNVVEKCLDIVNDDIRHRLIHEVFNIGKISSLIKNKFGNFVLQKAIKLMEDGERKEIRDSLMKGIECSSNKEKLRLTSLIEIL